MTLVSYNRLVNGAQQLDLSTEQTTICYETMGTCISRRYHGFVMGRGWWGYRRYHDFMPGSGVIKDTMSLYQGVGL